jgi:hypothetical protein
MVRLRLPQSNRHLSKPRTARYNGNGKTEPSWNEHTDGASHTTTPTSGLSGKYRQAQPHGHRNAAQRPLWRLRWYWRWYLVQQPARMKLIHSLFNYYIRGRGHRAEVPLSPIVWCVRTEHKMCFTFKKETFGVPRVRVVSVSNSYLWPGGRGSQTRLWELAYLTGVYYERYLNYELLK